MLLQIQVDPIFIAIFIDILGYFYKACEIKTV